MFQKLKNHFSEKIHYAFYHSVGPKWIWTWKTLVAIQHNTLQILTEIRAMAATLADVQAALAALTPRLNNIDGSLAKIQTYEDQQGNSQDAQATLDAVNALADHVATIEAKADKLDDVVTPVVGEQPPALGAGNDGAVTGGGETPSNSGSGDVPPPSTTPEGATPQGAAGGANSTDTPLEGDAGQVG